MTTTRGADEGVLDALMAAFLDAATNDGRADRVDDVPAMFVSGAVVCNRTSSPPTITSVEGFVAPRRQILRDGTITGFVERETWASTTVSGAIATRTSRYEKRGNRLGVPFEGRGVKVSTFVKVDGQWRFLSLAWEDEP
ncbi:MAG: hypothetical protein U0414_36120 [Polyangiaceae bacterium]